MSCKSDRNFKGLMKPIKRIFLRTPLIRKFIFVLFWGVFLNVNVGSGQTTVSYTGMGTITCPASPTATISPAVTGLTFSQITRGAGVTCASAGTGISGSAFNVTLANAITNSKWYTFSITSNASTSFTVSAISIQSQVSSAAGSPNVSIQYSIGGSSPTIVIGSFTPTTTSTAYNFNLGTPISVSTSQTITFFVIPNTLTLAGTTCRVENNTNVTLTTASPSSATLNSATLSGALSTTYGSPSTGLSFTASGTNLTGNITATAQTGYEVSTDNSNFSSSVSVASGTTVYVRFAATQNAGNYNGSTAVILSSTGATNVNVTTSASGNTVSPKALSITAPTIASKVYDATTTAGAVTVGSLSGFVGTQTVTATATAAAYSSADVGTYNNVAVTYILANGTNGGLAANYSLAAGFATGVINARALTITAINVNKEVGVALTGGAGSTGFTSSGLAGGQTIGSVTISYGAAGGSTGQGATPGTYTGQVTPSSATGGTFNASNYTISYVSGDIIVSARNAVDLTTFGNSVCQDFNSLVSTGTGTSTTMPTGWFFSESGSGADLIYSAGTGSSATGDTYSFGTTGNSDRTLGGLQSGSLAPTYGVRIYNNTGSTITNLNISYTGKTWRVAATSRSDRLDFQYSINATSLTTGTWTDENNLDYSNPGQVSTASGTVQHSASINYTIQGLNIAQGSSVWVRWTDLDVSGSDDGMGVDDVCITPILPCTSPDALQFVNQPSDVFQGGTMSNVTVKAYCTSTGYTASGYSGNITLIASNGGCGYTSQTVAAVNGVATFSNIVFSRSTQTGITLTASATGFSDVASNPFNVNAPLGATTIISQRDFDANNTLSYTSSIGGLGVFNTSNTSGVSNSNCLAFYYNDCLTKSSGSTSTATFSQTSGLTGNNNIKLNFSMAWSGTQLAGAVCDAVGTAAGLDVDDYILLETSINGGSFVTTFKLNGNGNKQYPFSNSGISLNHDANQILSYLTEPSAFTINLPAGTTSVDFRFTFKTNRRNEVISLDNFILSGLASGAPSPLPIANAGLNFNGCSGGPNQLQGSATNTVGTVSYNWTPTATLNNAAISNPLASNNTTTTYTLTVTDGDNCKASSNVTVTILNGTPGLWTGAENTDWFNCQNWASGSIPTASTDVQIPDVTNDPEIGAGTANCRNINLDANTFLTMSDATSQLNVAGNYTNGGTLNPGTGLIVFNGTADQTISTTAAKEVFYSMNIDKASGNVILNKPLDVTGVLTLTKGLINTSLTNIFTLTANATCPAGGSFSSFVNGPMRKEGIDNFRFPVGKTAVNRLNISGTGNVMNGGYRPISISGLTASANFLAEYQLANPYLQGPISPAATAAGLQAISRCEYWDLVRETGTQTPTVTLTWSDNAISGQSQCNVGPYIISPASTYVVPYYNSMWGDQNTTFYGRSGSITTPSSPLFLGEISWDGAGVIIDSYLKFVIGTNNWQQAPLPFDIKHFKAVGKEKNIQLDWLVNNNDEVRSYSIERSRDGVHFDHLKMVYARANEETATYADTDPAPFSGWGYYRLRIIDLTGRVSYSNIQKVWMGSTQTQIQVTPKPAKNQLWINLANPEKVNEMSIISSLGQLLYKQNKIMSTNQIDISSLRPGVYYVRLIGQSGISTEAFIKE